MELIVVMPTLNEAESIARAMDAVRLALNGVTFDILVVDGHSQDGTDKIASEKGAKVIYQKNRGYGDALRTGFLYVRRNLDAKAIVMMDADSTYDPWDIPKLIEPISIDMADMVVGNRFAKLEKGAMSLTNKIGNRILSWVARLTMRIPVHDTQCGLRAFRTRLVDEMTLSADGMPFATEMIADAYSAKARIMELPVWYRPRQGKTKLNPLRDGLRIFGTIIRLVRDTRPLLFFSALAATLGVIGLALGIDVSLEWFRTKTIQRLPTLLLTVLLLIGSMQLFTLGLIADMIRSREGRRYV